MIAGISAILLSYFVLFDSLFVVRRPLLVVIERNLQIPLTAS